jgi:plasmid stabilization system protein ParE
MRFRIEFSAEAERDFALIFDHLFEGYRKGHGSFLSGIVVLWGLPRIMP